MIERILNRNTGPRTPAGGARMWPRNHDASRKLWPWGSMAATLLIVTAGAVAQDTPVDTPDAPTDPDALATDDGAVVEPWMLPGAGPRVEGEANESDVIRLYRLATHWARRGSAQALVEGGGGDLPEPGDTPFVAELPVRGLVGVRVTLRRGGVTLGVGDHTFPPAAAGPDAAPAPLDPNPQRDLVAATRAAMAAALDGVAESLANARLRAAQNTGSGRDIPVTSLAQLGPDLQVDLQVARRLEPITLARNEAYHRLFREFAPGFHGLILHNPTQPAPAFTWPATALASNVAPESQLVQMLVTQGYRSTDIPLIAREGGPTLHRFQVIHYTRPTANGAPMLLTRGNLLYPPVTLSRRAVIATAERMARHLEGRLNPDGVLAGTYQPTANRYEPAVAPPDEQALGRYALTAWSRLTLENAGNDAYVRDLAQRALDGARTAARRMNSEARPDPAAMALTLLTLIESPSLTDRRAERDALADRLMQLRDEKVGFRAHRAADDAAGQPGPKLNTPTQALIAMSLAAMFEQTRQPQYAQAVNSVIGPLWLTQRNALSVTALPWLLRAELTMYRLGADRAGQDPAAIAGKFAYLGSLVAGVVERQIIEPPAVGPADVVGGFDLSPEPGSVPAPNWTSAFVLSVVAQAVREPKVHEGHDRLGWLLSCGLTARFLAQLTMGEPSCYYVKSVSDAIGGVRRAFWDNQLPVASTAAALLALVELERAMADARIPMGPDPVAEMHGRAVEAQERQAAQEQAEAERRLEEQRGQLQQEMAPANP